MTVPQDQPAERARRILQQRLESLHRAGVRQLSRQRAVAAPAVTRVEAAPQPVAPPPPSARSAPILEESAMPRVRRSPASLETKEDRLAALAVIEREVHDCPRCPVLVQNRTQTVFGVGNPKARVVFFGEAPGADEDAQGEPFVGRAGQLLDKIIEACTFKREDVYILNVLKCRPPDNRPPEESEIANCRGYFERQLEILRPDYIVCLGATAAKALLDTPWSIGRLRGKFHDYRGARVVATYHPAYLLRNPSAKAEVWEDMKMLLKDMGIELPRK